jgi:type IV secretory pathway TraG/TraD family ATPase VirD4
MGSSSTGWGRRELRGWPSRKPVWTIGAVAIALLSVPSFYYANYTWIFTPLERYYLGQLVSGAIKERVSLARSKTAAYRVVQVVGQKRTVPAMPGDVGEGETKTSDGVVLPFELPEVAQRQGWALRVVPGKYPNAEMRAWLANTVYGGQSLRVLARNGLRFGLCVLVVGLFVALPEDRKRARVRKYGHRLRGPEEVTSEEFNRRNKSDGIAFLEARRTGLFGRRQASVRVPRAREANHFLIVGDSGTGKSSLIRQMLMQIQARGHTAIVYDPAREYVRDFYDAARGDVILNPLDVRMPYWSPGAEVTKEGEALTLAKSLFPDKHKDNPFFVEGPRKLFAHLLEERPTAEELTYWLCHPEEIERRVKGSELEAMLDLRAPAQRAGVLSSLGLVVDALKLLPTREEAQGEWSAAQWSKKRRGWIFLTSSGETRESLLPLISLWLDMLVLRLMNLGPVGADYVPVWFVLDELASLQRLPQLHTAITENRKSKNPVVLGFQGKSQLEARYGQDAEAMLSQPATKIFLRTSEARAAKWVSETIGEMETERMRESRTNTFPSERSSKSDMLERLVEPALLPSQISGLSTLKGYLKSENLVVSLDVELVVLPGKAEGLIERDRKPRKKEGPPTPPDAGPEPAPVLALPPDVVPEREKKLPSPPPWRLPGAAHDPDPFFE